MKTIDTLVEDIYSILFKLNNGQSIQADLEPYLDDTLEDIKRAILEWSNPQENRGGLRMSNIGRPARQLWFANRSTESTQESPHVQVKFLYGHVLEQLLLMLCKASGHTVTDEQKEVEVDGIVGHMDCKIDGEVVDVKTASPYSFKKFVDGSLPENDSFGYMEQLASYEEAEGTDNGGFLVIDKVSGEIALYQPDDLDKPLIKPLIAEKKQALVLDKPPEICYNPEPEGKSGNMVINKQCRYCPYKQECWADANDGQGLRMFKYHNGIKYFTHVEKEPKVEEIK